MSYGMHFMEIFMHSKGHLVEATKKLYSLMNLSLKRYPVSFQSNGMASLKIHVKRYLLKKSESKLKKYILTWKRNPYQKKS